MPCEQRVRVRRDTSLHLVLELSYIARAKSFLDNISLMGRDCAMTLGGS